MKGALKVVLMVALIVTAALVFHPAGALFAAVIPIGVDRRMKGRVARIDGGNYLVASDRKYRQTVDGEMFHAISGGFDLNSPIPDQWKEYVTQLPAGLEIVPKVWWDTERYTSAVTRDMSFFVNTQNKTLNATNMKAPRMLPYPEAFLIQNIRIKFKNPVQSDDSGDGAATDLVSSFNDLVQLSDMGVLTCQIGEKQYGPWLPWALPANSFVKGAFSTGSDLLANYGQLDGVLYPLFPNLMISAQQPFQFNLVWPDGAITLSTGAESTLPIVVYLDGMGSRAIQ